MLNTIVEVAAVLFALLGGFVTHYLLVRNETIMKRLGLDYHRLRSVLHLFNYKPLYENPDVSSKILGPILDYLAQVCQLWHIPAVQGSYLRKNLLEVLKASPLCALQEELKECFLDTAKDLDESRGEVRALPKGLFGFVRVILILLFVIIFFGLSYICSPFPFFILFLIFFMLFFVFIYDLKRLDDLFIRPQIYDRFRWLFIRCLIFASMDKEGKTEGYKEKVCEYLVRAKMACGHFVEHDFILEERRQKSLKGAENVAKQFLEKKRSMDEDWEKEVEWTVPKAVAEVLSKRFRYAIFKEGKNPFLENLCKCWDEIVDVELKYRKSLCIKQVKAELRKRKKMCKKQCKENNA